MQTTHKHTSSLFASLALLVALSMTALGDPGTPARAFDSAIDDNKPSNCLVYNIYTSSPVNPAAANTRISITNVNDRSGVAVHFYFIDGDTCSVADSYVCLTKNQTTTFFASDIDPGITGYIIAMATDENGIPLPAPGRGGIVVAAPGLEGTENALPEEEGLLIGQEEVKFAEGHEARLPAEGILGVLLPPPPPPGPGAEDGLEASDFGMSLKFYVPRVLALGNFPSPSDGNNTMLIVNRLGGDLRVAMNSIGNIFGILYDQLENPYSWTANGRCQFRATLSNSFPRTAPRLNSVVPAGSVGWTKFWATDAHELASSNSLFSGGRGISGAAITVNPNADNSPTAFNGGANLSHLTLVTAEILTFPIFPPNCE